MRHGRIAGGLYTEWTGNGAHQSHELGLPLLPAHLKGSRRPSCARCPATSRSSADSAPTGDGRPASRNPSCSRKPTTDASSAAARKYRKAEKDCKFYSTLYVSASILLDDDFFQLLYIRKLEWQVSQKGNQIDSEGLHRDAVVA